VSTTGSEKKPKKDCCIILWKFIWKNRI
jgi:hypothetical protein